jgi:uncharacterized protein YktB (UPF0637 family)
MKAIQQRIQPKFSQLGAELCPHMSAACGHEMFLHIAKHARRTINAPVDTWMALCHNKRGYKQHPHFQIGLFDDHVFVWLAFIYELPDKQAIAAAFLKQLKQVRRTVRDGFSLSFDHMRKNSVQASKLTEQELIKHIERFRDVKKAELLIGRQINIGDPLLSDGDAFVSLVKTTFGDLLPLYKMALNV